MKRIEFHPEAERELAAAQAWYRERSAVAAQAFALEVDQAIRTIAEAPERWQEMRRGERRFVLSRFPYSILYRIRSADVFITSRRSPKAKAGLLARPQIAGLEHLSPGCSTRPPRSSHPWPL